jgi:branched-chain amino acid transport system permease protein
VAAAGLFVMGYVIQRCLINLVINAPVFMTLLLTFGLSLILVNGMIIIFTADIRGIQTTYASHGVSLGAGVELPLGRFFAFLLAIAVTVALVFLMNRTRTGRAIKATGMDRGAARLVGIRARHIYALTFGISAALAGIAGAMVGTIGSFSPGDADQYTLLSFVIAVLGGLGNMYGALIGGLLVGLVEAWGGQYLGGTLVTAIAFGVLVLVLIVRPSGLVGRAYYASRVEV